MLALEIRVTRYVVLGVDCGVPYIFMILVVSFLCNPALKTSASKDCLSGLIVAEDKDREWKSWNPPVDLEGVHAKTLVHAGSIT